MGSVGVVNPAEPGDAAEPGQGTSEGPRPVAAAPARRSWLSRRRDTGGGGLTLQIASLLFGALMWEVIGHFGDISWLPALHTVL
ncbi:MAG: hypothetical protein ACRDF6_12390, partial [bacterium]